MKQKQSRKDARKVSTPRICSKDSINDLDPEDESSDNVGTTKVKKKHPDGTQLEQMKWQTRRQHLYHGEVLDKLSGSTGVLVS